MLIQFLPYRDGDTEADPQGGSGGDGKQRPTDVLDRFGRDALKLAEKLAEALSDNYTLREQRRVLRQEVTELKAKAAPEGARLLTTDEAPLWDAYKALGAPDAIKKSIENASGATAELTTLKREKQIRAAAEAAGYKAAVLERLAADLTIEVRPVKDAAPVVVVVKDGQETALADYAKDNWGDFLPALEAKQGSAQAPDINAGARGNGNAPLITDDDRASAKRRYSATF